MLSSDWFRNTERLIGLRSLSSFQVAWDSSAENAGLASWILLSAKTSGLLKRILKSSNYISFIVTSGAISPRNSKEEPEIRSKIDSTPIYPRDYTRSPSLALLTTVYSMKKVHLQSTHISSDSHKCMEMLRRLSTKEYTIFQIGADVQWVYGKETRNGNTKWPPNSQIARKNWQPLVWIPFKRLGVGRNTSHSDYQLIVIKLLGTELAKAISGKKNCPNFRTVPVMDRVLRLTMDASALPRIWQL